MRDLQKGVYILPNLFTSGSLFLGFYAIVKAVHVTIRGDFSYRSCALAMIGAAFFDMMDGRVARKTNTASKFGVEYDSLSDLVSFGVAPALVVYLWALRDLGRIGWLGAFLYLACGALRLARFNLQVGGIEKKFFQGLPIPMAAMMVAGSILIWQGRPVGDVDLFFVGDVQIYLLAMVYLLAILMVSSIPYRSFKSLSLTSRYPFYYLFFVVVGIMFLASKPLWFVFSLGGIYLLSGPVEQYILAKPVQMLVRYKRDRAEKKLSNVKKNNQESEENSSMKVHPLIRS